MARIGRRNPGFTLVEAAVVLTVGALLAACAWPSWRGHLLRSHRVEATLALDAVERAQVRHLATTGRYAARIEDLPGAPSGTTDKGRYRLSFVADGPDAWRARAVAIGAQADDHDCAAIELQVRGAISERLPDAACWLP